MSSSIKNFSYVASGNIIGALLQAAFYFVFASLLEPEKYGIMTYVIALSGTFLVISRFGLPNTIVVYRAKENTSISNQIIVLGMITTGIASIILIPIDMYAALLCFGTSLFVINSHSLLGEKNYKKYFWVYLLKTVLVLILPILFYQFFDMPGVFVGMAIGNFVTGFNFFKSLRLDINHFRDIRNNLSIFFHNFIVDSSTSLTKSVDKLVIVPLFGLVSVATYQFNLQILYLVSVFPLALSQFLLSEESSGNKHHKITIAVLSLTVFLSILLVFVSPYIINEIFPKYSDGIVGLQIIIFTLIPLSITGFFNARLQSLGSTYVGYPALLKIFSLLGLIVILGSFLDLVGLSLSVLLSSCFETIFLGYLYKKSANSRA